MSLILASRSPARAALLRAAGYTFRRIPSRAPEPPPPPGRPWVRHLVDLASAKAEGVARRHPRAWVLGADTALWLDGALIGKAATPAAAVAMLARLGGRTHRIATAVCVIAPADATGRRARRTGFDRAAVRLHTWPRERLRRHVAAVHPLHCAGAYALQGGGAAIVAAVRGDPSTVIGLPLALVDRLLQELGYAGTINAKR